MKRGALTALPDGAAIGTVESPLGAFSAVCSAEGVLAVRYPDAPPLRPRDEPPAPAAEAMLRRTLDELAAYFAGSLRAFTVPHAAAGTPFQLLVWEAVREVPFGTRTTYGALAAQLGRANAPRAVGHANGANPVPIIIACHRLVGANGGLTGYGGGLAMKRWLLEHEARRVGKEPCETRRPWPGG